jgi:hypothetical protein
MSCAFVRGQVNARVVGLPGYNREVGGFMKRAETMNAQGTLSHPDEEFWSAVKWDPPVAKPAFGDYICSHGYMSDSDASAAGVTSALAALMMHGSELLSVSHA